MFHSTYLRLTLWYLAIIMLISFLFSITLYSALTRELDRGLRRQALFYRNQAVIPSFDEVNLTNQLNESKGRVALNLVYFNIVILIFAGGASYFLAKRTLRPIEESLDQQRQFTADASHELRTPLTAMKTELEVALREKALGLSEAKGILKSSLEEVTKLEDISNALLVLSKVQDRSSTYFEEVSLKNVVETSLSALEPLAKKKKIKIITDISETKLQVDKESLINLIKILLDNAIKYSPENSEIILSNKISDNFVYFKIQDQGIGIQHSDLPHIFKRFFRADTSRSKQNTQGFGLGLSIAERIVDNHHGKIEVESSLGNGSIFTIKLPLKQP